MQKVFVAVALIGLLCIQVIQFKINNTQNQINQTQVKFNAQINSYNLGTHQRLKELEDMHRPEARKAPHHQSAEREDQTQSMDDRTCFSCHNTDNPTIPTIPELRLPFDPDAPVPIPAPSPFMPLEVEFNPGRLTYYYRTKPAIENLLAH